MSGLGVGGILVSSDNISAVSENKIRYFGDYAFPVAALKEKNQNPGIHLASLFY